MKSTVFIASLVLAVPCFAGNFSYPEVTITTTSATTMTATGSVQGARYSNDRLQSIGCSLKATKPRLVGSSTLVGTCTAVDRAGVQLSCSTADAVLIEAMTTVGHTSTVSFTVDTGANATGDNCKTITVENVSAAIK